MLKKISLIIIIFVLLSIQTVSLVLSNDTITATTTGSSVNPPVPQTSVNSDTQTRSRSSSSSFVRCGNTTCGVGQECINNICINVTQTPITTNSIPNNYNLNDEHYPSENLSDLKGFSNVSFNTTIIIPENLKSSVMLIRIITGIGILSALALIVLFFIRKNKKEQSDTFEEALEEAKKCTNEN